MEMVSNLVENTKNTSNISDFLNSFKHFLKHLLGTTERSTGTGHRAQGHRSKEVDVQDKRNNLKLP
jgi:nitrate reductase alpha subunit